MIINIIPFTQMEDLICEVYKCHFKIEAQTILHDYMTDKEYIAYSNVGHMRKSNETDINELEKQGKSH